MRACLTREGCTEHASNVGNAARRCVRSGDASPTRSLAAGRFEKPRTRPRARTSTRREPSWHHPPTVLVCLLRERPSRACLPSRGGFARDDGRGPYTTVYELSPRVVLGVRRVPLPRVPPGPTILEKAPNALPPFTMTNSHTRSPKKDR